MQTTELVKAIIKGDDFTVPTMQGINHHDVFFRVTLGQARNLPMVLVLPTGIHISDAVLQWLRRDGVHYPEALRLIEALLGQDIEPVTVIPYIRH